MAELIVLEEVYTEIEALANVDEDAAATILLLFEELANDEDMLEKLYRPHNHFRYSPPFEFKRFEEMQKRGKNVFSVKARGADGDLLPCRALLGYHAQIPCHYVLTVQLREIAYDPASPVFCEVLRRYENAGIPTYRY